jgi:hypothetical protein
MQNVRRIVKLLDEQYSFLGIKFGIDPLLNLFPGLGNLLGVAISIYLFWIAYQKKSEPVVYFKMALNIILDFLMGVIPVLGLIFDLAYKSNVRNLKILENSPSTNIS